MTERTKAGMELADKLAPAIGWTHAITETCSLIHRAARSYCVIQERWCSEEMSDRTTARVEAREAQLERRIDQLVGQLPETDEGPFTVLFGGDPRGHTVKIVAPGEWARKLHDDWGLEGIGADF